MGLQPQPRYDTGLAGFRNNSSRYAVANAQARAGEEDRRLYVLQASN
jgi:hypothetical protein